MAFSQVDKSVAIDWGNNSVYGYYTEGGLDEYDTDAEPQLQAGFKVEVGDDIYLNDTALSGTGWSGIANDTQVYLYIVPSGTSATLVYSATAPTWSSAKAGWYNSNDRAIWICYKNTAGTGYYHKQELKGRSVTTGGTTVTSVVHTGGGDTAGDDFIVTEPGSYYINISDITYTANEAYVYLQYKVNSTYLPSTFSVTTGSSPLGYFTSTALYYAGAITLNPGTYRLYIDNFGFSTTATITLYRAGRMSNNL